MKVFLKILLWTSLTVLALLLVVYLLASLIPPTYQPERLSEYDKRQATMRFYNKAGEFRNHSQTREPFSVTYTQKEVNEFLASIDDIVGAQPDTPNVKRQYGSVYAVLSHAGLADPAVHFSKGVLTVMIRRQDWDKMVSAALKFDFDEKHQLHVSMSGAYVGRLRVPDDVVRWGMMRLRPLLVKELEKIEATSQPGKHGGKSKDSGAGIIGFGTAEIATAFSAAITAIDEKPIPPARLSSKGSRTRITAIDVEEGQITLQFMPVSREEAQRDADAATGKTPASASASSQSRPATSTQAHTSRHRH